MKKITIILLLISSIAFGQKKPIVDSVQLKKQDSIMQAQLQIQAINFVTNDIKETLYGRVDKDKYSILAVLLDSYIQEKQRQFAPKETPKK